MASRALEFLTVLPTAKHTASVIVLHGLGDSGHGWRPVAQMLAKDPKLAHIKWILPHAHENPVTLNMGMSMPSWFDIASLELDSKDELGGEDSKGMLASSVLVNKIITAEVDEANIPADRIILGGFSQGAALSLLTGLTSERKLGGIFALSGWLPLSGKIKAMMSDHARSLPIFFGHGTSDPVVQYQYGMQSYRLLKTLGFSDATTESVKGLSWQEYAGMGHSSCPKEIQDIGTWFARVIPEST